MQRFPTALVLDDVSASCRQYLSRRHCLANPSCGWCLEDSQCMGREEDLCRSNLRSRHCPGVCSGLPDCLSCAARPECSWCAGGKKCYPVGGAGSVVACPALGDGDVDRDSGVCVEDSVAPGSLTAALYHNPVNDSLPDAVFFLNESKISASSLVEALEEALILWRPEGDGGGWSSADSAQVHVKIMGFLKVLKSPRLSTHAWTWSGEALQVCQGPATTMSLRLSQQLGKPMETLKEGSYRKEVSRCYPRLKWPGSGRTIYLYPGNLYQLEVDLAVKAPAKSHLSPVMRNPSSALFLLASSRPDGTKREILTSQYLLPYRRGSCEGSVSCLGCMVDSLCAWCPSEKKCVDKRQSLSGACREDVVTTPEQCPKCGDLLTCQSCLGGGEGVTCEWQVHLGRCIRRGRSSVASDAVRALSSCAPPCHLRSNCSSCVSDDCVWCETTRECFAFSSYTTRFAFGRCTSWVDRFKLSSQLRPGEIQTAEICQDCPSFANCSSCVKRLGCGWCHLAGDPLSGRCETGGFGGSDDGGVCGANSPVHRWAYAACPDVEECALGLHDCHPEHAECINTPSGFECRCRKGE